MVIIEAINQTGIETAITAKSLVVCFRLLVHGTHTPPKQSAFST